MAQRSGAEAIAAQLTQEIDRQRRALAELRRDRVAELDDSIELAGRVSKLRAAAVGDEVTAAREALSAQKERASLVERALDERHAVLTDVAAEVDRLMQGLGGR